MKTNSSYKYGAFHIGHNESLPSGYWEPQPDKEDEERMEREFREGLREPVWPDEPLPFE